MDIKCKILPLDYRRPLGFTGIPAYRPKKNPGLSRSDASETGESLRTFIMDQCIKRAANNISRGSEWYTL